MKKVAIMQPYLFPYIGYYQLLFHSDVFVFLDDVNFIKGGFIAKNFIRGVNDSPVRIFVPVEGQSQNRQIDDHYFSSDCRKAKGSLSCCYSKARCFANVMPMVVDVLCSEERSVARVTASSIRYTSDYLGMKREFFFSSEIGNPHLLRGQERIIDLCKRLGATDYTNPIGGVGLYDKDVFDFEGIRLGFIKMRSSGLQFEGKDYSRFSIIDVLMHCPKDIVLKMLQSYEII